MMTISCYGLKIKYQGLFGINHIGLVLHMERLSNISNLLRVGILLEIDG